MIAINKNNLIYKNSDANKLEYICEKMVLARSSRRSGYITHNNSNLWYPKKIQIANYATGRKRIFNLVGNVTEYLGEPAYRYISHSKVRVRDTSNRRPKIVDKIMYIYVPINVPAASMA